MWRGAAACEAARWSGRWRPTSPPQAGEPATQRYDDRYGSDLRYLRIGGISASALQRVADAAGTAIAAIGKAASVPVDIRLIPGEDQFTGSVEIGITILQPASTLWLHGKSLAVGNVTVDAAGAKVSAKAESVGWDFIAITTDRELAPGDATLHITYTGEISRTLTDGVFQQQQGNDWYIFTKFEPVTARRAFPCFDEPSYKAPWQLTLHVPAKLQAFSNTPVEAEKDEAGGMRGVRFRQSKLLPSYLVAFAVGPLEIVPTEPIGRNRVPGRIIVPRGRQPEASVRRRHHAGLIALLEEYYGTPYPYEKLDQVVVPLTTSWGAMENAGMIAYGDFLLAPPKEDTELQQRWRSITMLHECRIGGSATW